MSQKPFSRFLQAWFKWKSIRLPWRRRRLAGYDLQGNTYWEFRIPGADNWRRIVHYPRSTHYSEVKVPPDWHQWLRYTRPNPPTFEEQTAEQARQQRIKILAAQADARWEATPRVMGDPAPRTELPNRGGPSVPSVEGTEMDDTAQPASGTSPRVVVKAGEETQAKTPGKADPWARARNPGQDWQPEAWTPPASKKR